MNVCGYCGGTLTSSDPMRGRWGCLRCDRSHDADIGVFCVIAADVVIQPLVRIGNYVELRNGTRIGTRCHIDSYVVTSGDCTIGDDVTLRYGVIVAKGTVIGEGCYLAPRVMTNNLNHRRESVGGAKIGKGVFIGTHAVLAAGISICDDAIIGSCAFVTKDIVEPGTYIGVPARKVSQ